VLKDLSLLRPHIRKHRGEFAQGVATLILASLCSASIPLLIKYAVDGLQSGSRSRTLQFILITGLLAALQGLLRYRSRMKILNGARVIEYELRKDFFSHLVSLPYSFFRDQHRGDLIARIMNDMTNVRMMVGMTILHFSSTLATVTLSLVMMLKLSVSITILAILPLCLLFLVIRGYMGKLHTIFKDVQDTYGRLTKGATEVLSGIRVVKNYLLRADEETRFERINQEYMEKNLTSTRLWGMVFPSVGFLGGVGTLIVMWIGGYFLMSQRITLGDFIALNAYYAMLMWPVVALAWILNLYQRGVASLKRIEEIYAHAPEREGGIVREHLQGEIELRHVSVTKEGQEILADVSFSVKPREKLLIIGPTGSGKTTILNLILGLEGRCEGEILIDGLDAKELSLASRRERIAIVPQDPFLYSSTIRENLFPRNGVEGLIDVVHMTEEIKRFDAGLETIVGERGITLSGGQKQRLTIARALAGSPDILLFDDPFTHVDSYTEHMIWQKAWPLIQDKSVIITSTKPVPVQYIDKVIVLADGRVWDAGRPEELLKRNPYMKLLYEVKASGE
jgi:ATP-binding cassette, subfamily B, multidrug efflux pump